MSTYVTSSCCIAAWAVIQLQRRPNVEGFGQFFVTVGSGTAGKLRYGGMTCPLSIQGLKRSDWGRLLFWAEACVIGNGPCTRMNGSAVVGVDRVTLNTVRFCMAVMPPRLLKIVKMSTLTPIVEPQTKCLNLNWSIWTWPIWTWTSSAYLVEDDN